MTQPARLRCNRGHYIPRHFRPHGDPEDWDDTCRCRPTHPATPHTNRRPHCQCPPIACQPALNQEEP